MVIPGNYYYKIIYLLVNNNYLFFFYLKYLFLQSVTFWTIINICYKIFYGKSDRIKKPSSEDTLTVSKL